MPNYFDTVLAQLLFQQMYPRGATERKKVGGEWADVAVDPLHLGPNARKGAQMQASLAEDERLRGALGSSRRMRKGENIPSGSYSLAEFPGLRHQVWAAESGFLPKGYSWRSLLDETDQDRAGRMNQQRQWAAYQNRLLGWGR